MQTTVQVQALRAQRTPASVSADVLVLNGLKFIVGFAYSRPSHPRRCNVLLLDTRLILLGGTLVDAAAAVVIGYSVIMAILSVLRVHGSDAARLLIARGVLSALGFSVAGSLLKIIALQTWEQIRLFAFVFVLRTSLKRVFAWEETRIQQRFAAAIEHKQSGAAFASLTNRLLSSLSKRASEQLLSRCTDCGRCASLTARTRSAQPSSGKSLLICPD